MKRTNLGSIYKFLGFVFLGLFVVFGLYMMNHNINVFAQANQLETEIDSYKMVQSFLQAQFCKDNIGIVKFPYKDLVVVDLNNYFTEETFNSSLDSNNLLEFLYEFLYTHKVGGIPFNLIIDNGKIVYSTCNKWDFTLALYLDNSKYGKMVVGLLGDNTLNIVALNKLVSIYKFDSLYTAKLGWQVINKNNVLVATNFSRCGDCYLSNINLLKRITLATDSLANRPINVSIADIKFPKNIESLEKATVTLKITNNLDLTIFNEQYGRLYIKELSTKQIPDLYVKSWESLHIPVIVNKKNIGPKKSVNVVFEIGPYVYPKTYKGKFAIFYGNRKLPGTEFTIATKVTLVDKQLGYIVGRELDYVNVRAKPDLRAKAVFKLDVGEYVIVNKVDGAWVNITSQYGDTGWVYRPLIRLQ